MEEKWINTKDWKPTEDDHAVLMWTNAWEIGLYHPAFGKWYSYEKGETIHPPEFWMRLPSPPSPKEDQKQ